MFKEGDKRITPALRNLLSATWAFSEGHVEVRAGDFFPPAKYYSDERSAIVSIGWLMKTAPEDAEAMIAAYHADLLGVTP